MAYQSIGETYLYMGKIEDAHKNLLKSLSYSKELEDADDLHLDYTYLGLIELKNKNYTLSKSYLEKANELIPNSYTTITFLVMVNKEIGEDYDKPKLISLINHAINH